MERYKKGNDRDQISLLPMCLDDMVSDDAEVRALEIIVDKMDICSLGFTHCETKQTGRMAYDPVDMFKLYAYSYFNGIRSSRKIERECYRNIELMWLIGGLKPDFKTIADFRKDNKQPIKAAFQKFSIICCELGLIGKEIVAVDGSKFRASNSRLKYHSEKKIEEKIKHHAEKAEMYMELLDACDQSEDVQPTLTREEIIVKISKVNKRLVELSTLKEEVSKNGTIYETDRDSRMMKTNNNGCDICHNVQIAVDDKAHLVVAVDVTSQPVDKEQLYNMASQAKENLEIDEVTVVADKGYIHQGSSCCAKQTALSRLFPVPNRAFMSKTSNTPKKDFNTIMAATYARLVKHCFLSARLKTTASNTRIHPPAKIALKNCTTGEYRMVQDRPFSEFAREVDKRTKEQMDTYHLRKQVVEHPFGTIKRAFGFSYFLTRGTENVRTESLLHFLVYNMKRAINMVGMQGLQAALSQG